MIASVQMIGLFVGNFFSGHLADALGRKPPIFISLAIILVFSIVAFLSTSWVMFAVARTAIGKPGIMSIHLNSHNLDLKKCIL